MYYKSTSGKCLYGNKTIEIKYINLWKRFCWQRAAQHQEKSRRKWTRRTERSLQKAALGLQGCSKGKEWLENKHNTESCSEKEGCFPGVHVLTSLPTKHVAEINMELKLLFYVMLIISIFLQLLSQLTRWGFCHVVQDMGFNNTEFRTRELHGPLTW